MANHGRKRKRELQTSSATAAASRSKRVCASIARASTARQPRNPHSALLSLPTKVQLMIIDHFDLPAEWALKRVNKYFSGFSELRTPADFFKRSHEGPNFRRKFYAGLMAWKYIDADHGYKCITVDYIPCCSCCRFLSYRRFLTYRRFFTFKWLPSVDPGIISQILYSRNVVGREDDSDLCVECDRRGSAVQEKMYNERRKISC